MKEKRNDSVRTEWEGLWKTRQGVYRSVTFKRDDLPKYFRIVIRHNKFYNKCSEKQTPYYVCCFANGDSERAITVEKTYEEYVDLEELSDEVERLKEELKNSIPISEVRDIIRKVERDVENGYTDNILEDYYSF